MIGAVIGGFTERFDIFDNEFTVRLDAPSASGTANIAMAAGNAFAELVGFSGFRAVCGGIAVVSISTVDAVECVDVQSLDGLEHILDLIS